MENNYRYSVATRCFTYNQAQYIEDSLSGFAMQVTDFPVVFIVVDDASTDGEPDVLSLWANNNLVVKDGTHLIREMHYGQLIEGTLKGKPLSTFVLLLLSENYYQKGREIKKFEFITEWLNSAKYQAFCEGDDYWTDPLKLQKQYDYMLSHPECGMSFTNFDILYEDGMSYSKSVLTTQPELYPHQFSLEQWILRKGYVGPMTWLIRNDLCKSLPDFETVDGTFVQFSYYLSKTEVGCLLNDTTAVYRRTKESASHSKHVNRQYKYLNGLKSIQIRLANYYSESLPDVNSLIRAIESQYYRNMRYLLLCTISGDKKEIGNATVYIGKRKTNMLSFLSRYKFTRFIIEIIYKTTKKTHWFFYKKHIK